MTKRKIWLLIVVAVRSLDGPREEEPAAAVRLRHLPCSCRRLRRADGLQRTAAVLHREGREGVLASEVPHLLQPARPPAVQVVRAARRKTHLRHRRDRRLRPGVTFVQIFVGLSAGLRRRPGQQISRKNHFSNELSAARKVNVIDLL